MSTFTPLMFQKCWVVVCYINGVEQQTVPLSFIDAQKTLTKFNKSRAIQAAKMYQIDERGERIIKNGGRGWQVYDNGKAGE